ncbi:MAG: alpha/beta hydrolase [Clostridiales bacterium]|nr:alpha/beta hydrolase [Clostridiales bacterium]
MKKALALLLALALCLSLAACGSSTTSTDDTEDTSVAAETSVADASVEEADASAEAQEVESGLTSDVLPEDVVGNTYIYTEVVEAYGFSTDWELTFTSDTEGTLFEPNDMLGDNTYTTSWTYADGLYTVTLVESENGEMTESTMFDENYTCDFVVMSDGTFAPANASTDDTVVEETANTGSENADYPAVSYASNSDAQVMDIYLPENATGSDPVIVLVHGGGFMFGDQTMDIIQPVIEAGVANGYVVASVDYRKSSEASFPAALSDVKAAVRYLRANAETYGIDADKVAIWGESAGAYLSLMTALTPEVEDLNGDVTDNLEQSSAVTALVDFYGPVEFYTMDAEYEALGIEGTTYSSEDSFESAFVGQAIGEDEETTYKTWWYTYVDQLPEDFTLSAWIQVGDSDTSVPYTQSQNFAEKLAEVLGEDSVTFGIIEGAEHEDDLFYTDDNLAQVFDFLADALN